MNFRLATVNENSYVRANPFVFGVVTNLHDLPDFALVLASNAPGDGLSPACRIFARAGASWRWG